MRLLFALIIILSAVVGILLTKNSLTISYQRSSQENVNWQEIEAISTRDATEVNRNLARMLDYWHQGKIDHLHLEFLAEGVIVDGFGNRFKATPEEWKGLVLMFHRQIENAKKQFPEENIDYGIALAVLEELYEDDLGRVKRFLYRIRIVNQTKLSVENRGPREHVR